MLHHPLSEEIHPNGRAKPPLLFCFKVKKKIKKKYIASPCGGADSASSFAPALPSPAGRPTGFFWALQHLPHILWLVCTGAKCDLPHGPEQAGGSWHLLAELCHLSRTPRCLWELLSVGCLPPAWPRSATSQVAENPQGSLLLFIPFFSILPWTPFWGKSPIARPSGCRWQQAQRWQLAPWGKVSATQLH